MLEHIEVPFLLFLGLFLMLFFITGYIGKRIKLPSLIIYIIAGISLAYVVSDAEAIHIIAEIGIVLLFFLLGLEFPLSKMTEIFKKVLPGGILDLVLCLGGSMAIAYFLGMNILPAFLIGGVAYASSSSITAKLLEDKKRLANPETEYILALLIFEDIAAPIIVSLLAGIYGGSEVTASFLFVLFSKIIFLIAGAVVIAYFGFRKLTKFVEQNMEADFMPLLILGTAFAYGGIAIALGLSEILGAFLAGIMLSETGHPKNLEHIVLPVRDITLPFFFFYFGTNISIGQGVPFLGLLAVLVFWSLAAKVAVGYFGGQPFGLTRKASLRAGLQLGQRGEFSAIIATMAPPQLRIFSGIYVLITALLGIIMFSNASKWVKAISKRFLENKPQESKLPLE